MADSGGVSPRTVLLVGAGGDTGSDWAKRGYRTLRLDIEPRTQPDIVGSMTAIGDIEPVDAVYCSHALEHLYPHEVPMALAEFKRVLKPGGVLVIVVPDLEGVPATDDVLPGANVSGLHLYYGDASRIAEFPHMAHHSGFVAGTLRPVLIAAGFSAVATQRMSFYNLLGTGIA